MSEANTKARPSADFNGDWLLREVRFNAQGAVVDWRLPAQPPPAQQPAVPAEFDVRTILLDVVPGDGSGLEVYAKNVGDVERVLTELSESEESLRVQVDILKAAVEARGKVSKVAPVSLPEMTDEEIIEAMKSAGWPKVLVNHVAGARTFMIDLSRKSTGNDPDCNAPA